MWLRLKNKLAFLLRGDRFDRELAEELEFHRHMLEADKQREGLDKEGALLSARRQMGNTTAASEDSREAWLIGWLDTLARDLRYGLRVLARNPGFAAVAVLTLGLGIGGTTAMFRLVDLVMLRMLPVRQPEELLVMRNLASFPRFERLRDDNDVFTGVLATHTLRDVALSVGDRSLGSGSAELVTGNYFSLLGVNPVLGRAISTEDDKAPESSPVAVISHGLWRRAFGLSPDVLGRTLRLRGGTLGSAGTSGFEQDQVPVKRPDHASLTIVGVAPPGFFGDTVGTSVDVWVPVMMQPALMPGRAWLTRGSASWLNVMGRRRPGVTESQARASLTVLWRQIRTDELGASISEAQRRGIASSTINVESGEKGFATLRRRFSEPLPILMTVVVLVLLIACLNVANLLLARATARRQEVSMRLSLGASRGRIVRQLLTESLVLAALGGLLGLGIATLGTGALLNLVSGEGRRIELSFEPDRRILAFTTVISLLSAVLFGLAPALRGTGGGLQQTLKDAARATSGGRRPAARSLVAIQVAVSLVLLVAAGLFLRTLHNLKSHPVGYDPEGLVLVRVDPVGAGYRGDEIGRACIELMSRLAALPGVGSLTFSENGLFSGTESGTPIDVEGFTPATDDDRLARFDQVGPGYFVNVGIPLLLGRDMSERDAPESPRVTVINETMARFYFPKQSPIGRHIRVRGPSDVTLEIVGVARDAKDHGFREAPVRRFYVSYLQPIDGITTANFEIRTSGAPAGILGPVREEIRRFNPSLKIESLRSLRELMDANIVSERLVAKLSGFFGALAVILAAIGLYGVMSYTVARRANEIGIRMALGARQSGVTLMILREVVLLVACGAVVGLLAARSLTRYVSSIVFGLTPTDPLTYLGAAALLLVVGVLAGYLPARRAARIDPLVALRYE